MAIITILLAQLDVLWRNPTGNLSRLQRHLVDIEGDDQQLLVLPEMLSTGFTDDLDNLTEAPHGPWESSLMNELNVPTILGIARRQPDGRITNEAVYLKPDQERTSATARSVPFEANTK